MRHTLSYAALVLLTAFTLSSARAQTPLWSEEFNTPNLDPSTWTFDVGGSGFGNQELQYYTNRPQNVSIQNGSLVITGRREAYNDKQFTSARLKTHGRFAFRYGRIEGRIKIPNLQNGLWPAFWLLGKNIGQTPWPGSGEIDILEMGHHDAIVAGIVNKRVYAAGHWDYYGSYAQYGSFINYPVNLYEGYHTYALNWTPQLLSASLDGIAFWQMDISAGAANSMEEFHRPMFIVLNLAVGGINFVQITNPSDITAPFPAPMYVDWIRLYDNGYTELYRADDDAESGNFGVFTETTPVNDMLHYDVDSDLFTWHNVTVGAAPPYEGASAWLLNVAAGDWFGLGAFCRSDRNMRDYSDGALHLHVKMTSTATIGIGIASSAAGEGWLDLVNGGEQFGLVRDGQWHEVVIPLNRFANIDFRTIKQAFMIRGVGQPAMTIAIDNIYWSPSVPRPTPANGNYGLFTENAAHKTAGEAVLGVDQDLWLWSNTLVPATQHPYEGSTCISLQSAPGATWFGAALMPRIKHNLSAYRSSPGRLHFALKTTSTVTFQIGMKSGNADNMGQRWITFANGQTPYGFVRDGQWHVVEIPMTDFGGVDLLEVNQIFELLGTNGPITNIEIDDICFLDGAAPLIPGRSGDLTLDGYVDSADFGRFAPCLLGPDAPPGFNVSLSDFAHADFDQDGDVDNADFAGFQAAFGGSN